MLNSQDMSSVLIHWSFGLTILVGLVASEFTGAESLCGLLLAAFVSAFSTVCSCVASSNEQQYRTKRLNNIINFLILWSEALVYLLAASTCARLASATVDYISKGHFREFLFGMEQHSLGEPWPDVLGVTIILVVTALFMMGLEKSTAIIVLLFLVLVSTFGFFISVGSLHSTNSFHQWVGSFKLHSFRAVIKAAAFCSFAFVQSISFNPRRNWLKIFTLFIVPTVFYVVLAMVFSLMTRYRELVGTAIPLVQVFENRDVDWARPVMAVFTICIVCLLLTEITPNVSCIFVKLASREWKVFVSSIQFRSQQTGAPVLAIFAAGSLAAILAFACPLSHLIKLLNVTSLVKCALVSCQMVVNRYKPEITCGDFQVYNSNVHYSKLNQDTKKVINNNRYQPSSLTDKIKNVFRKKPTYIHRLSSPKNITTFRKPGPSKSKRREEKECLLQDKLTLAMCLEDDSNSEAEANEMEVLSCSEGDESESSTDIDVIVEEYKEGLKVTTTGGKYNDTKPSTRLTSILVIVCLFFIVLAAINISLYMYKIIHVCWPNVIALLACALLITAMPSNSTESIKPCLLPAWIYPTFHSMSITLNILLASTIIADVWEGIVFWTLAGLFLYWRCDCCNCEGLEPIIAKASTKMGSNNNVLYEYKESLTDNILIPR